MKTVFTPEQQARINELEQVIAHQEALPEGERDYDLLAEAVDWLLEIKEASCDFSDTRLNTLARSCLKPKRTRIKGFYTRYIVLPVACAAVAFLCFGIPFAYKTNLGAGIVSGVDFPEGTSESSASSDTSMGDISNESLEISTVIDTSGAVSGGNESSESTDDSSCNMSDSVSVDNESSESMEISDVSGDDISKPSTTEDFDLLKARYPALLFPVGNIAQGFEVTEENGAVTVLFENNVTYAAYTGRTPEDLNLPLIDGWTEIIGCDIRFQHFERDGVFCAFFTKNNVTYVLTGETEESVFAAVSSIK